MRNDQKELIYYILKKVALAPKVKIESGTPFLNGLAVRSPMIDLTDAQAVMLADVLNELGPEGDKWTAS